MKARKNRLLACRKVSTYAIQLCTSIQRAKPMLQAAQGTKLRRKL